MSRWGWWGGGQSPIVVMKLNSNANANTVVKCKAVSVFIGSKMLCLLNASKVDDALALVTDLSDSLEDRTLEVRIHAL